MIKFDVWMSYEENMNVHVLIHVLLIRHPNVKLVDVIELTAKGNLSLQKIICIFTVWALSGRQELKETQCNVCL